MSRGPGRWQRVILATLEAHPAVYLRDLLPVEATRAQYVALHRAAWRLYDSERIAMWTHRKRRGNQPDVTLGRLGHVLASFRDVPRLCVVSEIQGNTYEPPEVASARC